MATDIAEVPNQIVDEQGNVAGLMIPLRDWKFSVEELAATMAQLANDTALYQQLKNNTASVSEKFSIDNIVKNYLELYGEAINN